MNEEQSLRIGVSKDTSSLMSIIPLLFNKNNNNLILVALKRGTASIDPSVPVPLVRILCLECGLYVWSPSIYFRQWDDHYSECPLLKMTKQKRSLTLLITGSPSRLWIKTIRFCLHERKTDNLFIEAVAIARLSLLLADEFKS